MLKNRRYQKASSKIVKRHKIRKYIGRIFKITLTVIFLIGFVFLLRADFLQINTFEVLGTEVISADSIKNTATDFISGTNFFIIPKSNILFLNKQKLISVLMSEFPRLAKVGVNKKFLKRSVELTVMERKEDFLWCSVQDECFFVTKDGLVFEKTENMGSRIIFRGILKGEPLMKSFTTPAKMQNYFNFIEILKDEKFEVSSINIESSDKAVAKTNVDNIITDVIFNPEEADLSPVAQNIILLVNDIKNKNPSARFEYIDARFGNKIFYKLY